MILIKATSIVDEALSEAKQFYNRLSEAKQFYKGRTKFDDPEIDTAQTPKRLDERLALLEKIRNTFTDSILNNTTR